MKNFSQVFIFGAPRSGTTFLASLLDKTKYKAPFETHFITKYYKKLEDYGDLQEKRNFKNLINDIFGERAVRQWKIDPDIDKLYYATAPDFEYSKIINEIISLKIDGGTFWGDKTPNYLEDPGTIIELFPEAKFLFIVRDGRDVALSLLRKSWGPNNFLTCGEYWSRLNDNFLNVKDKIPPGSLFELKYEEVLTDPERHIKAVYDFLEEDISEDNIMDLANTTKSNNSGKWASQATTSQLRRFESAAATTLKVFGYSTASRQNIITSPEKMLLRAHEAYCRFVFLFKTNVIDGIKIHFFDKEPFNE
ncbi:sulfotransferase [Marinobacter bryozoorum]|uniref:sulfotransferase family protein n=1 Tax=Marinobacter bryozoorum TaxID=256324 RepID=UPI002006A00F|nr:sulfotransferase [Marinobacter bryozoorum]MCK7544036.1 sulfotransferase [Marinobacter bryozoorum]